MSVKNMVEGTIGVGGESEELLIVGNCDIWVSELTSGTVKLQIKFPGAGQGWRDVPEEEYTTGTFKTIFISEHGVYGKLLGVANNAGTYVRLARFLND